MQAEQPSSNLSPGSPNELKLSTDGRMLGVSLVTGSVRRGLGGGTLPCTDLPCRPHVALLIMAGAPGPAPAVYQTQCHVPSVRPLRSSQTL